MPTEQFERADFFDRCKRFDWWYKMSDDPGVYRAGEQQYRELQTESEKSERNRKIFAAWSRYKSSPSDHEIPRREDFDDA